MRNTDRHDTDRIARAVVSGRRGRGAEIDRTADFLAGLMTNRLAALGAGSRRGAVRQKRRQEAPPALNDRRALEALLRRVEKHLGHKVAAEGSGGGSSTR